MSDAQLARYETFLRENYAKARDELHSAYQSARTASNAARRAMKALGHGKQIVTYRVELGTIVLDGYMPTAIEEVDRERLSKDGGHLTQLQEWTREFVVWVDNWVEMNAPEIEGA